MTQHDYNPDPHAHPGLHVIAVVEAVKGAGKSTLLTLCGGLLRPSAGTIRIGPNDLAQMDESALDRFRATEVGIVLQGAKMGTVCMCSTATTEL